MPRPAALLLAALLPAVGCVRPDSPTTASTEPRWATESGGDERRGPRERRTSEDPAARELRVRVLPELSRPDVNILPDTPRPGVFPVAPPPRPAGQPLEHDLTNTDPGLDSNIEAALPQLERIGPDGKLVPEFDPFPPEKAFPALPDADPENPPKPGEAAAGFTGRAGEPRKKLLKEYGGTVESERAVALGLAWLAKQQKADGSWVYDAGSKEEVVAATGMALLAFLGSGETHDGKGKYAKTVKGGLDFLLKSLPNGGAKAGKFAGAGNMYAQAIGTLALCEAYGLTKDKNLLAPAQAAVDYIQKAQGANGSWGYTALANGDTSIVGWQVQALQAALLTKDIKLDKAVIKKAVAFLDLAAKGERKAEYGYTNSAGAAPGTALTAVGLWCRYHIDGWGPDNGGMAEGVKGLMRRLPVPKKPMPDLYFYSYATQVVRYFDGDEWKDWNEGKKQADDTRKGGMRDWIVGSQVTKEGPDQGSWEPDGGWIGRSCGRVGTTAMCVLTLETYYRYLPLYKRKNADGAEPPGAGK